MIFSAPYYLVALLGILVPIAIHLWNRKKGRVIKVGSIKLLTESDTHKMSSLKISEWFLMFLRIGLIVLLVLLMSGLHSLVDPTTRESAIALVDREYYNNPDFNQIIDSLDTQYDLRFFESGFPSLNDEIITVNHTDHWTLMSHLDELISDSIIIYAPLKLDNFQSEYSQLPEHVTWISLPEEQKAIFIDQAYWQSADSLQLIIGVNTNDLRFEQHTISLKEKAVMGRQIDVNLLDTTICFSKDPNDKIKINNVPSITIGIYTSDKYLQDLIYFETAFATLDRYTIANISFETYQENKEFDMVVWLANEDAGSLRKSSLLLTLDENIDASKLIMKVDERQYKLTHRVNPYFSSEANLLELPKALLPMLNEHFLKNSNSNKNDERLLDVNQLYANSSISGTSLSTRSEARIEKTDQWFWLIFLLLFLMERSVSLMKKA